MNRAFKLLKQWNPLKTSIRHNPYGPGFKCFIDNAWTAPQYTRLPNCLTIATEERVGWQHACIGLYIDAGTRYEADFENGVSHFFEHLVYRGTKNRDPATLAANLNESGAIFRCYSTREMICFYALCLTSKITMVIDLLSDCVFCNSLSSENIENQKNIVYLEMLEADKNPNSLLSNFLHSAAYQGTPLARSVSGTSANLYSLNSTILSGFLNKFFCPTRTVLASVGGIRHSQVVSLASCYLNNMQPMKAVDPDICRYTGSDIRYRDDSMPVGNVMIAVEGPCLADDDNLVMDVARYALGSWDRSQISGSFLPSRLGRMATSGAFICDAYDSFNITYKDTGLWGMQFISEGLDLDDMCILVQEEWLYLCHLITEAEVQRARRFYKSKYLSKMLSSEKRCHDLGRWTLYNGSLPPLLERLEAIDNITANLVRKVCSKYIVNKCPVVAAIGRIEGLMDYNRQISGNYWLRI